MATGVARSGKGLGLGLLVLGLTALVAWVAVGMRGSPANTTAPALALEPGARREAPTAGPSLDPLARASGVRALAAEPPHQERTAGPDGTRPIAPVIAVIDELERPLAGARVALADVSTQPGAAEAGPWVADEHGRVPLPFELDPSAGDGRLALDVSLPGYFHTRRRVKLRPQMPVMLRRAIPLTGFVTEGDGRAPVAGARVSFRHKDCTDCADEAVFTGPGGAFHFEGIPVGRKLELLAEAEGYVNGRVGFRTEPTAEAAEQDLVLEPGLALAIEVVDALTGAPLPEARVKGVKGPFEVDAAGRLESDQLATSDDGRAKLTAYAPGYCQLTVKPSSGSLAADGHLSLPLVPAVTVEGRVRGADGRPRGALIAWNRKDRLAGQKAPEELRALLPGVEGCSLAPAMEATDASLRAEPDGTFRIEGALPFSPLLLGPSRPAAAGTPDPDAVELAGELETTTPGPGEVHRVVLEALLEPLATGGGAIAGRLTVNGEGERGTVLWRGATTEGLARTDKQGNFTLERVESGTVELTPRSDRVLARTSCSLGAFAPTVVQLAPGQTLELDIDVELPMTRISGTAILASGTPLEKLEVKAEDPDHCWRVRARTDAEGAFELEVPLDLAAFDLIAKRSPQTVKRRGVPGGATGIQLEFAELGQLRVRALDDSTGAPLDKGRLDWRWQQTSYQDLADLDRKVPLADGWYELDCPAGSVDLLMRGHRDAYLPRVEKGVRVYPGAVTEVEFRLRPSYSRRVVFGEASEELPADAAIAVVPLAHADRLRYAPNRRRWEGLGKNSPHRELKFKANGSAVIRGLRPGKYRFVVWPDDLNAQPAELAVQAKKQDGTVRVTLTPR